MNIDQLREKLTTSRWTNQGVPYKFHGNTLYVNDVMLSQWSVYESDGKYYFVSQLRGQTELLLTITNEHIPTQVTIEPIIPGDKGFSKIHLVEVI
jgi:hypothetical protein